MLKTHSSKNQVFKLIHMFMCCFFLFKTRQIKSKISDKCHTRAFQELQCHRQACFCYFQNDSMVSLHVFTKVSEYLRAKLKRAAAFSMA